MKNMPLPRLDTHPQLWERLQPYCRLRRGDIWEDPAGRHRVGCLDAANPAEVRRLMQGHTATLALHDPPYNMVAFEARALADFIAWCRQWLATTSEALAADAALYVWLGADQRNGFQPLPDFMLLMRETGFQSRSFITLRNQRGYGTHKNWMAVRQELLYYTRGNPPFHVAAEYTDIPRILRGYYKNVRGTRSENGERSKSPTIRAGNVWVDIQQVFYRMQENVNGCYAQKPLKACERIICASSNDNDRVIDFFCHSGTTLLAAERHHRRCLTMDSDPVYCEIAIRRLEHLRATGQTGWQNSNPFAKELGETA
jgi:site-specific DNA-methyltransferase (adenine-specific)